MRNTRLNSPSDRSVIEEQRSFVSRRSFVQSIGVAAAALGLPRPGVSAEQNIPGFEKAPEDPNASKGWQPISDRKIRVGLVGNGVCKFASAFGFQEHPNVKAVAVSDLIP